MRVNRDKSALFLNFYEMLPKGITVYPRISLNEITPLHKHNYVELFFITNGEYKHIFNGKEELLSYGNAYLLNTNDVHGLFPVKSENSTHTDILIEIEYFKTVCDFISPDIAKKFLSGEGVALNLSTEQIAKIESYMPDLFLYINKKNYAKASKLLCVIIIEILATSYKALKHVSPKWLLSLLDDLNNHENFSIDISTIISKHHYNVNYMRRIFKQYTGMTMTDYFNRQKSNYAYMLLSTTDLSVEQICEKLGFLNVPYFYCLFKKQYRKTPKQVREIHIATTKNLPSSGNVKQS